MIYPNHAVLRSPLTVYHRPGYEVGSVDPAVKPSAVTEYVEPKLMFMYTSPVGRPNASHSDGVNHDACEFGFDPTKNNPPAVQESIPPGVPQTLSLISLKLFRSLFVS